MPVFDALVNGGGYPPTGCTVSGHALGSGSGTDRIVLLAISIVGGTTHSFSGVAYNGQAMTLLAILDSPSIFGRVTTCAIYYLLDSSLPSTAGSYSATYTSTNGYNSRATVISYTGALQSAPSSASASNSNNPALSGIQTTNKTVSGSSGLLFDAFAGEATTAPCTGTAGGSQTERSDIIESTAFLYTSDKVFSSSGSNSMSWTPSNTYWAYSHIIAEIQDSVISINIETANAVTGTDTTPFNITVTGKEYRGVIVMVAAEQGANYPSAVTVGGASATNIRNETSTVGGGNSTSMWVVLDSQLGSAGAKSVAITYSGSTVAGVVAVEINGWDQVVPTGSAQNGANNAAVTSISASVTPTESDSLSIEVASHGSDGTPFNAAPTGSVTNRLTSTYYPPDSAYMVTGYGIYSSGGSKSATETSSGGAWNRASMIHAIFSKIPISADNAAIMGSHF